MQELDELHRGGKKSRVVRRKSRVVRRKSRVGKKKSRVVRKKSRVGKKKSRVVRRKTRVSKKKSRVVKKKTCGGRRMQGGGMQHLTPADYTHTPVQEKAENVTEGNEDLLDSVAQ